MWAFHRGSYPGWRRCPGEGTSFHPCGDPHALKSRGLQGDQAWTRRTGQLGTGGCRWVEAVQPCTQKEGRKEKVLRRKEGRTGWKRTGGARSPPRSDSVLSSVCLWGHRGREDTHHAGKRGGPWHHVPDHHGAVQKTRGLPGGEEIRGAHQLPGGTALGAPGRGSLIPHSHNHLKREWGGVGRRGRG